MKKLILFIFTIAVLPLSAQQTMTPELLWKLGRVSIDDVSADGKSILYGVTYYDLVANKGTRNLYLYHEIDGKPVIDQVTKEDKSVHNGVLMPGGGVGFLQKGQWYIVNSNGDKIKKTDIAGGISNVVYNNDFSRVFYTADVKTGKTTLDKYPKYTKSNVRIIDDLMYRHWDHFEDEMSSHAFWATLDANGSFNEGVDVMSGEPFETPLQPFAGAEQLVWSPDGQTLAYTSKKKWAMNTPKALTPIFIYSIRQQGRLPTLPKE